MFKKSLLDLQLQQNICLSTIYKMKLRFTEILKIVIVILKGLLFLYEMFDYYSQKIRKDKTCSRQ